ncbi:hypothetical protein H1R20_g4596, partial [Candolleomyces eurysporus]
MPHALRDESAVDALRSPGIPPGKRPIDLIIDFLTRLWEYTKDQITRDIGAVTALSSAIITTPRPVRFTVRTPHRTWSSAMPASIVQASVKPRYLFSTYRWVFPVHSFSKSEKPNYSGVKDDGPQDPTVGLINGQLSIPRHLFRRELFSFFIDQCCAVRVGEEDVSFDGHLSEGVYYEGRVTCGTGRLAKKKSAYTKSTDASAATCENWLQYLVSKGTIIRKGQRLTTKFCKFSQIALRRLIGSSSITNLYVSNSDKIMRYTDKNEILELCKWTVSLTSLPTVQ